MLDPTTVLRDLEKLAAQPCPEWTADLKGRGVELDCEAVAAGQACLREALAGGGTHHDVLGRLGVVLQTSKLSARKRLVALAVADVARANSRRSLLQSFGVWPASA